MTGWGRGAGWFVKCRVADFSTLASGICQKQLMTMVTASADDLDSPQSAAMSSSRSADPIWPPSSIHPQPQATSPITHKEQRHKNQAKENIICSIFCGTEALAHVCTTAHHPPPFLKASKCKCKVQVPFQGVASPPHRPMPPKEHHRTVPNMWVVK